MDQSGSTAALLGGVPLFARLPIDVLTSVAETARPVDVAAGAVLFSEGEAGNTLYVVISGRLVISVDGEMVRSASRADVIGELALLTGQPRSATVRAVRETRLMAIDRDAFLELLSRDPAFGVGLIEVLAARLPRSTASLPRNRRRGVVMLSPHDATSSAAVERFAVDLGQELKAITTTSTLTEYDASTAEWGSTLDRLEAGHNLVLLVATARDTSWWAFCHRQADRRLAVVDGAGPHAPSATDDDLVLMPPAGRPPGGSPASRRHWIDSRTRQNDVRRVARRLAGRSVGVVLSGGGARGFAHIGVLEALEAGGVTIDRWGGTSMGALVAGLRAAGFDNAATADALRREMVSGHPFRDYNWPRHSLIKAERASRMLRRLLGDRRIESLASPYFCVSCDLNAAAEVVHRHGPLADAVGASMRIPGITPPFAEAGRLLVDGGVLNNLPVDVMAEEDEGPVIAVDVMSPFGAAPSSVMPGIVDLIGRSMALGSWQKAARTRALADLVITPSLGSIGLFDFGRIDELIALGRASVSPIADQLAAGLAAD